MLTAFRQDTMGSRASVCLVSGASRLLPLTSFKIGGYSDTTIGTALFEGDVLWYDVSEIWSQALGRISSYQQYHSFCVANCSSTWHLQGTSVSLRLERDDILFSLSAANIP